MSPQPLNTALSQTDTLLSATPLVYVANAEDGIISRYKINVLIDSLEPLTPVTTEKNVMPLAIHPNKTHLYASLRAAPYKVVSFAITDHAGNLTQQAEAPLPASMAYISTDFSGKFLLAASYHADQISESPINEQGCVTEPAAFVYPTHSIIVHPSNKFVYVSNLGADKILQYQLNTATGELTPIAQGFVNTPQGAGPRHPVISPDERFLYMLNEMHASISYFEINKETGALQPIATYNQFPANHYGLMPSKPREQVPIQDHAKLIWATDIKITPNGQFLYTTERTSHTLSAYRINTQTGELSYINSYSIEKQPRSIAIDPTGNYLVTTGQLDDKIGLYVIDQTTGQLTRTSVKPLQEKTPIG